MSIPPLRIIALPLLRLPLRPGGKLNTFLPGSAGATSTRPEDLKEEAGSGGRSGSKGDVDSNGAREAVEKGAEEAGPLIYWHVSQNVIGPTRSSSTSSSSSSSSTTSTAPAQPAISLLDPSTYPPLSDVPRLVTDKASSLWLSWGQTGDDLRSDLLAKKRKQSSSSADENNVEGLSTMENLNVRVQRAKYATWRFGEGMMDKIAFEEWALKTINPAGNLTSSGSSSEKVSHRGFTLVGFLVGGKGSGFLSGFAGGSSQIPLYIPSSTYLPIPSHLTAKSILLAHLTDRLPLHKTLLYRSLILLPFLAPIGLLPVVPNLPGMYVMWRAWSHWKAGKGGEFMKGVLEGREGQKAEIEVVKSEGLDGILTKSNESGGNSQEGETVASKAAAPNPEVPEVAPDATATPPSMLHTSSASSVLPSSSLSPEPTTPLLARDPDLYLTESDIPLLKEEFSLSPAEVVDITRAVMQAKERLDAYRKAQAGSTL